MQIRESEKLRDASATVGETEGFLELMEAGLAQWIAHARHAC